MMNRFLYPRSPLSFFNLFIAVTAYFNPLDCTKLLTTDQYDQIRVYSSSDWSKPQHIIQHPHRQFQHLTPIKVCFFLNIMFV